MPVFLGEGGLGAAVRGGICLWLEGAVGGVGFEADTLFLTDVNLDEVGRIRL